MTNDDAARALYTQCINMPGNDEWCIALLAAALDEARREGQREGIIMNWTTNEPTVPGWYWYRHEGESGVVHVRQVDLDQWQDLPGFLTTEWAGPLEPPKEAP